MLHDHYSMHALILSTFPLEDCREPSIQSRLVVPVTIVPILGGATCSAWRSFRARSMYAPSLPPNPKCRLNFLPISVNNLYPMLLPMASALGGLDRHLFSVIQLVLLAAGLLLLWRLWRFTIRPAMKPNQPRRLPYWIPCGSPSL